jgi:hypothetical protein
MIEFAKTRALAISITKQSAQGHRRRSLLLLHPQPADESARNLRLETAAPSRRRKIALRRGVAATVAGYMRLAIVLRRR